MARAAARGILGRRTLSRRLTAALTTAVGALTFASAALFNTVGALGLVILAGLCGAATLVLVVVDLARTPSRT